MCVLLLLLLRLLPQVYVAAREASSWWHIIEASMMLLLQQYVIADRRADFFIECDTKPNALHDMYHPDEGKTASVQQATQR